MRPITEKRLFQSALALACLVPLSAGIYGILGRIASTPELTADADSHFRYLSGLLLGIGLCFLSLIPNIESNLRPMRLLTAIVVIGGVGRLLGVLMTGAFSPAIIAALIMELIICPLMLFWQSRIARV